MFSDTDVVDSYSRAEAIAKGLLVERERTRQAGGFSAPVAVTRHVWDEVVVPGQRAWPVGQSVGGRLTDVLWVLRCAAAADETVDHLTYRVLVVTDARRHRHVMLKAACGAYYARAGHEGDDAR